MERKSARKENHCLNLLKGFACIGVVFGHALFPGKFGVTIFALASAAVPIFFLISGYYAYGSDCKRVAEKSFVRMKKTLHLTVIACLIYIVWKFLKIYLTGGQISYGIRDFNLKNLLRMLVVNDLTFIEAGHFWFLLALIYAYITLWILAKFQKVHWIYPIMILTFIGRVYVCKLDNWHYSQNYWFDGLPYFFMGYCLSEHRQWKEQLPSGFLVAAGCIGILLKILPIYYSIGINICEVGAIIFVVSMFILALKYEDIGANSIWETLGKKYSLWIYISHVIVMGIVMLYEGRWMIAQNVWYPWLRPIMIFIITLGMAIVYEYCKKRWMVWKENRE